MRLVSSVALAVAAVASPKALVQALLAARVAPPAGFSSPMTTKAVPGADPRRHHVVGEVEIDFNGGSARVVFAVFPTRADALGNHADGLRILPTEKGVHSYRTAVPGLPRPSVIVEASAGDVGVTQISFVADNVEVAAQTAVLHAKQGNPPATLELATFALRQLRAVERHVR